MAKKLQKDLHEKSDCFSRYYEIWSNPMKGFVGFVGITRSEVVVDPLGLSSSQT